MNAQPNTTYTNVIPLFNTDNNVLPFKTPRQYIRPEPTRRPIKTINEIIDSIDNEIEYHDALPIRDKEDIKKILNYYWNLHTTSWDQSIKQPSRKWNPRYLRNHRMFMIGIHCGLRCSDLKTLRVGHFIREDGTYKDIFPVHEQKTSHIKSDKDTRTVYVTKEMIDVIELYKQYHPNWTRYDLLFPNSYDENKLPSKDYLSKQSIDKMIKTAADKLEMPRRGKSCHIFRKTFAYHILQQVGNDDKAVRILQKILGHSSLESTQYYLGITQQDMLDVCTNLHLG